MSIVEYVVSGFIIMGLFVSGIQLLRGKWLMLIAGYNTMSKAARAKVNGRNLGKLMGTYFLIVDVLFTLMVFEIINWKYVFVLLVLGTVFIQVFSGASKLFKM